MQQIKSCAINYRDKKNMGTDVAYEEQLNNVQIRRIEFFFFDHKQNFFCWRVKSKGNGNFSCCKNDVDYRSKNNN